MCRLWSTPREGDTCDGGAGENRGAVLAERGDEFARHAGERVEPHESARLGAAGQAFGTREEAPELVVVGLRRPLDDAPRPAAERVAGEDASQQQVAVVGHVDVERRVAAQAGQARQRREPRGLRLTRGEGLVQEGAEVVQAREQLVQGGAEVVQAREQHGAQVRVEAAGHVLEQQPEKLLVDVEIVEVDQGAPR